MRAASLLLIFLLAKVFAFWSHGIPLTAWSLIAFTWQDGVAALIFAALESVSPLALVVYWFLAIYTAINIPVGRVLSTPLTWPMLRAARGPLADSLLLYVNATNCLLILITLAAAAVLPFVLARLPWRVVIFALPLILLGPLARTHVDTRGMDRNVIGALMVRHLPRMDSPVATRFVAEGTSEDLSRFGGIAKGRSLIVVSLESTAAQYVTPEVMPYFNALAQHALVFENAYAVYPESIKGLFSVLCSTFPAFDSQPEEYEKVPCRSVAAVLADSGYRTAMFHSGRFGYLGMESIIRNRGYQLLEDAGDIGGNRNSSFGVDEPATVARMLAWIDTLPHGQPFFLTYLPIAGHHPYATPNGGPFSGNREIDQYRNALYYGDVSLGALMEGLRARGLEKNIVWVIYGDHGEAFGQHPGNYGHTFFLYEENVHVPFLIAVPGLIDRQERVGKVVSLVDTAPTILDLMGIAPPANYQGRTMLDAAPRIALFFADYSLGILGLRDGPWKFIYEIDSSRRKLFEVKRDPAEMSDVATSEPARVDLYEHVVRNWSSAQKNLLLTIRSR